MTNNQDDESKIKLDEKTENILNNLLNYFEKENPLSDLSYHW